MNVKGMGSVCGLFMGLCALGMSTNVQAQGIPEVQELWFMEKPFKGCDGEMVAEPPGADQFEKHENEQKRKTLKAEAKDKVYRLRGGTDGSGSVRVELTKYDFKKNKQTLRMSVPGASFTGKTNRKSVECSGDKIDKAYCLGFCMWGEDYCTNEHSCYWKDEVHALEMKIPLSVDQAKALSQASVQVRMTVKAKGIVRKKTCVKESYDCEDLNQKPSKIDAGPEPLVRIELASLILKSDGEVIYEEGVERKKKKKGLVVGKGKVKGKCSQGAISKVVEKKKSQWEKCVAKAGKKGGKGNLLWTVGPKGKVKSAKAGKSSLSKAALQCMTDKVQKWTFPKGAPCRVQWPVSIK